jgi:hypothetical protein
MASEILGRECGSIMIKVESRCVVTYTRALALPPQGRGRAQVTAFLDKCPDIIPIFIFIKDEGIDVRCTEIHCLDTHWIVRALFADADPSYFWWKKLYDIARDKTLTPDHLAGHFIMYGRTMLV